MLKTTKWIFIYVIVIIFGAVLSAFIELQFHQNISQESNIFSFNKALTHLLGYSITLIILFFIDKKNFTYPFKKIQIKPLLITLGLVILFLGITRFEKYFIEGHLFNNHPPFGRAVASLLVFPVFEEFLSRWLFLNKLVAISKSKIFAITLSSSFFACLHFIPLQDFFGLRILSILIMGVILSLLTLRYKNLLYAIIFHAIVNLFAITCI